MKCLLKAKIAIGEVQELNVDLLKCLKEPANLPKDQLPLWRFITLKDGAPLRAINVNYDTIHALILEFDKGVSIEGVQKLIQKYSYAMHTTSSHTKEHNRFRVILPLDGPYPEPFWTRKNVVKAMVKLIPGLDDSCFRNYQCIPVLPANPDDYFYEIHSGTRFNFGEIINEVHRLDEIDAFDQLWFDLKLEERNRNRKEEYEYVFDIENYIEEFVIGRLDSVDWFNPGDRDNSLISFCGKWKTKCKNEGISTYQILRAVESYNMPQEFKAKARKKLL